MRRKKTKFLRLGYTQYSKLGLRRKNKQKYRRAKGGENKVRLKMKGHLRNVSIGFRNEKKTRGLVQGLKSVLINSIEDLKKLNKNEIAIVAHIGNKKRKEIAEYALKNNIRLSNINPKKFLEKLENQIKQTKEEKLKKLENKKIKEKKTKEAAEKKDEAKEKDKETIEEAVKPSNFAKQNKNEVMSKVASNETDIKENTEEIKK